MAVHEFTKESIESLLRELGRRLAAKGAHAEVFVLGGSAMAMAYSTRRVTADIDAIFQPVEEVTAEVEAMARDKRLPRHWLSNAVLDTLHGVSGDDAPRTAFEAEGVTVSIASPEYILALKAMIHSRELDQDIEDAATLCLILGIAHEDRIEALIKRYFGPHVKLGSQELRLERIVDRAARMRAGQLPQDAPGIEGLATRPSERITGECGHWMKIAKRYCGQPRGHQGQHR